MAASLPVAFAAWSPQSLPLTELGPARLESPQSDDEDHREQTKRHRNRVGQPVLHIHSGISFGRERPRGSVPTRPQSVQRLRDQGAARCSSGGRSPPGTMVGLRPHPASPTDQLCKRQTVPCRFAVTGRCESVGGARAQREGSPTALALSDRPYHRIQAVWNDTHDRAAQLRHFR